MNGASIEPGAHDRRERGARTKKVNILRDSSSARCRKNEPMLGWNRPHVRVISDVNEIERGLIDEVLVARDSPRVDLRDEAQSVSSRVVNVNSAGMNGVNVELLGVERRGRRSTAGLRPIDAECGPQQIG
jgi:hypothetical protein